MALGYTKWEEKRNRLGIVFRLQRFYFFFLDFFLLLVHLVGAVVCAKFVWKMISDFTRVNNLTYRQILRRCYNFRRIGRFSVKVLEQEKE